MSDIGLIYISVCEYPNMESEANKSLRRLNILLESDDETDANGMKK